MGHSVLALYVRLNCFFNETVQVQSQLLMVGLVVLHTHNTHTYTHTHRHTQTRALNEQLKVRFLGFFAGETLIRSSRRDFLLSRVINDLISSLPWYIFKPGSAVEATHSCFS